MVARAYRWSDEDRYFWRFTWSYSKKYPHWAIELTSAGDEERPCTLRITLLYATLIVVLPNIIRPWREKVYPGWDEATIKRLGRDWYWNIDQREYGISYRDGYLSVAYGRQGGSCRDSRIQCQWGYFLPWTQWRHVRHSLYGLDGEHVWTEPKAGASDQAPSLETWRSWETLRAARDAQPNVKFLIRDFDGETIEVTTRIEEREWRFGTGWFGWLSWFRRPKVQRSLDISFSKECGPDKGSWKGGVCGTSIEMFTGELHEGAFRRYCAEEHRSRNGKYRVTYFGRAVLA